MTKNDLKNKLDNHQTLIVEMNMMVNSLLNEEEVNENIGNIIKGVGTLGKTAIKSPVGRYLLRKAGSIMKDDIDNKDIDTKNIKKDDVVDVKDVDDLVDKIENEEGSNAEKLEKIEKELSALVDKQLELLQKYKTGNVGTIKISFNSPIEFELKRGKSKGEKLKLEKTKEYDVYNIEKPKSKRGKYKIYFTYKQWMRENSIIFSLELDDLVKDEKIGDTTINIVYIENRGKNDFRIISEKPLTKKGVIEIESLD